MSVITLWVLVVVTHVYGGSQAGVYGDFADLKSCEAVQRSIRGGAVDAQCVEVSKAFPK